MVMTHFVRYFKQFYSRQITNLLKVIFKSISSWQVAIKFVKMMIDIGPRHNIVNTNLKREILYFMSKYGDF